MCHAQYHSSVHEEERFLDGVDLGVVPAGRLDWGLLCGSGSAAWRPGGRLERQTDKDQDILLAVYDFPVEHWRHIRTTNPVESALATIRLRHRRTKASGSRRTSLAMMYKLRVHAEKRWRRLNGHQQTLHLAQGKKNVGGIMQEDAA